jgi:hypothetical protein
VVGRELALQLNHERPYLLLVIRLTQLVYLCCYKVNSFGYVILSKVLADRWLKRPIVRY